MDRGVIATASELYEARHYAGVIAMTSDALDDEPECIPLLLIRARARIALRRELDAQADLRDVIRLDPGCGTAFRLLGELAARRHENESASIFFREALRLCPDDQAAADWLQIVRAARPVVAATRHPAAAATADRPSSGERAPAQRVTRRVEPHGVPAERISQPRFAKGTQSPDASERPTQPFGVAVCRDEFAWTPPGPIPATPAQPRNPMHAGAWVIGDILEPKPTMTGLPPAPAPAQPAPRVPPRPLHRGSTPELPGFGDYLVSSGILSRERLRAAQAYQRSMKVQLATAIVTLGLATPQRIEWAAVAHQSELGRGRP